MGQSNIISITKCNCCQRDIKYKENQIKLCTNCKRKSKRLAYRISAANYKNNECEICGLKRNTLDDLNIFDFHHKDRSTKSFELGDKIESKNWEVVKQELDKCMMLCANCHRKQHLYTRNQDIVTFAENLLSKYS
jgi:glutamate/tyrosine decarboxylase-like PLP-dependent enzyme